MGRDEPNEESVEEPGGVDERRAQPVGGERAPSGDRPEFREERTSRRDEEPDGLGQAEAGGREASGEVVGERGRTCLRGGPGCVVVGVEIGQEGRHEATTVGAVRVPMRRRDGCADVVLGAGRRIAPSIRARQAVSRSTQGSQWHGRPWMARLEESLDLAPVEPPMAARRHERLDATLVRPAAQRIGVDAQQASGRAERQPARVRGGGSGHGREFQLLALGEYGAGQGWDAVGAARYLAGLPYCNGKIGMYGGSYGARMTMAAVTRDSTPFTAVAPLYGSYDWEEAYPFGDRLEQKFTVELHMGFKPGENPDLYAHTAAKRHLDKVKRDLPFFMIHGERDRRTPFMQFGKLIEELKRRGNPIEYYSYPEEAHGIRLAKNRTHAYSRMIEFFKKHLVAS